MGRAFPLLLVICLISIDPLCYSQTPVQVSDPRIEMVANTLLISYDILNSRPGEMYFVTVDIKDEEGNPINAKSLSGDIGEVKEGGNNKEIIWNLDADDVFLTGYLLVQINARVISPSEPVVNQAEEQPPQEVIREFPVDNQGNINQAAEQRANPVNESPSAITRSEFSRTGIIFQSLLVPGLGLSRVTGKPHWIRAVAGYGSVAGSIVLNRMAIQNYDDIESLTNFDDVQEAYDKSLMQDRISQGMMYGAIGIWVADLIWTVVGTSDLSRGLSVGAVIDPVIQQPLISLRYRF